MYGQIISTDDFSKIRIFCPDLVYIDQLPLYGDNYIIDYPKLSPQVFRNKFKKSILMSPAGIDLSNKEKVLQFLDQKRKLTKIATDTLMTKEGDDFWNAVKIYLICGKVQPEIESESIYKLFKALGGSKADLIKEEYLLRDKPLGVQFSSIVTFLVRMKNIADQNINPVFRRDLMDVRKRITSLTIPVVKYLKSEQEQSDFLYFLLSF